MAEKRMFSQKVVCSDRFLNLPPLSQCLYFQLGMAADDDGFVDSPQRVARMVMATETDLDTLCKEEFVIPFRSGVIVLKHWNLNNWIRRDRYKETIYANEKRQLQILPNKLYSYIGNQTDTSGIPDDNQMTPQIRLDKSSIDNTLAHSSGTSEAKNESKKQIRAEQNEIPPFFAEFWEAYPRKVGKAKAIKAFRRLRVKEPLLETMLASIAKSKDSLEWQKENGQFIPHASSWLNGRRWEDEQTQEPVKQASGCWERN